MKNFSLFKRELSKKNKYNKVLKNVSILTNLNNKSYKNFKILTKPVRTISGVAPVAIMTKPGKCPHGSCIYCPGGLNSYFGDLPKSYTGKEPATRRAIRNDYDPYLQVMNRLEHYTLLNHNTNKIELIVMGGTFLSFSKKYQEEFIKYSFKAMNDFSRLFYKKNFDFDKFKNVFNLPGDVNDSDRTESIKKNLLKFKKTCSLEREHGKNETSNIRCIALCIETRPDFSTEKEINQMLRLGTTRVELGVQTLYDNILKKIERGHEVKDIIKATQLLKDSFLKTGYHIMPGLPYSNKNLDIKIFKDLFSKDEFKPDALKIYPCMVVKGTKLYDLWKKGKYNPLTTKKSLEIIKKGKKYIPKYVRVLRVQRDIPTNFISAGVDRTNLRQYLHESMKKEKIKCNCIRCREPRNKKINWDYVRSARENYSASKGHEVFLSFEDTKNDILLGFCRLRIPYKSFRKEITPRSAGIRELHVYGTSTLLGKKGSIQHKGLGKKLIEEAEKITKEEFDCNKLLVISGIGVKEYYKKLGYKKDGVYVSKKI